MPLATRTPRSRRVASRGWFVTTAGAALVLALLSPTSTPAAAEQPSGSAGSPADPAGTERAAARRAAPSTDEAVGIARGHVKQRAKALGVTPADVGEMVVASTSRSEHSGVTHVNLTQRYQGLEVFGAQATVNVASDGEVIHVGDSLVKKLAAGASGRAKLGPLGAVRAAAPELDLPAPKNVKTLRRGRGPAQRSVLSGGETSDAVIPARLGWQPTKKGLRLAWQLVLDDPDDEHLWNAMVDAANGELLQADDWVTHDNVQALSQRLGRTTQQTAQQAATVLRTPDPVDDGSSYRVFPLPQDSPNDGAQDVVQNPADAVGSPHGWHDTNGTPGAESATTRGNNAHAYLDQDANNGPDHGTAPPFYARTGEAYLYSQISELSYKRLTREIAVPASGGNLTFWANYAIEPDWDFLFVEARTPGAEDWTTLPDANGHTTRSTGQSCQNEWHRVHPRMKHYQTWNGYREPCDNVGTTGEWNAATGTSHEWQEWSIDLSAWSGETVEISIAYATDWNGQGAGVGIDDVTLPDGTTTSFEDDLGDWVVGGPPPGTDANLTDWERVQATDFPQGGPGLDFDAAANLDEHAQNNREAATNNLFYTTNIIHDVLYRYGFDEEAGNFQSNNYGRGGTGGDFVRAEAQDGSRFDNANFRTPVETPSSSGDPTMQMFLFPGGQHGYSNQVVVEGVGTFDANLSRFGAAPTSDGITAPLFDADFGCTPEDYANHPTGEWIAVVTGYTWITGTPGGCRNVERALQAQAAGATAVIFAEGLEGKQALSVEGDLTVDAPSLTVAAISNQAGEAIRSAIAAGPVTATVRKHPNHPGIRDSSLDNGVVVHEYGHGLAYRLTGGPTVNCLTYSAQAEQASEGWSDFLALVMTLDPNLDDPEGPRGIGTYVEFDETDSRTGKGFRIYPYSRNMAIQPQTYDSISAYLLNLHAVGTVWAAMLWDMTWDLIDKHGFEPNLYAGWDAGGNARALQYVIDGLKFQGCEPGFVTARDAIIAAADELSNGEDTCTIWASFARRGLGYSAVQGTSTFNNDNAEAFDTHPDCVAEFEGDLRPEPRMNHVKAGSTSELRFSLGGDRGMDVLASGAPYSRQVDCGTLKTRDPEAAPDALRPLPVPTETPGGAELSYDASQDVYVYPWQTMEEWEGTCRELVITRTDGIQHRAYFRFDLTPRRSVSGHVYNAENGQPVEGATLTIGGVAPTTTDVDGYYSFADVPRGSYTVRVTASPTNIPCLEPRYQEVDVTKHVSLDFRLPKCPNTRVSPVNGLPEISGDGRYVAFNTTEPGVVDGDTNGEGDVFVTDTSTRAVERVSVASDGTQANDSSRGHRISDDGNVVVFSSTATNLVAGDTNGREDVFVHDRSTGVTERVSVATGGSEGDGASAGPNVSADGRYVTFFSRAANLVADDSNGQDRDVFVHDRATGVTELVSVNGDGDQADGSSFNASISGDGRFVAFHSSAALVGADTNGEHDVYVRDRVAGTTQRVSVATDGTEANDYSRFADISDDGQRVVFWSGATNLVAGDSNGFAEVFVHDLGEGTTERVAVSSEGAAADAWSNQAVISADGRYVAFVSEATNLIPGDTNGFLDVFVRDLESGTTELVSDVIGQDEKPGNDRSGVLGGPSISADGRYVAFQSFATDLVPAGGTGLFVRDRG